MKSDAAGYQVRCPVCGLKVEAGRAGLMISQMVGDERRLGYCSACDAQQMLFVEKRTDPGDPNTGYAPGYQVRCLTCGLTEDASQAGLILMDEKAPTRIKGPCARCAIEKTDLMVERVA